MSMKKNLVIILAIILHSGINTATGQETDRVKNNPDSLAGRGDTATIFREMELQEVTIQASRIRNSARGYTINLKDEPLCKGKTVSQLLGFLPGISVEDGVVKTDGKPVSIFYLNGMKVSSDDILKLPADVLNSAEVEYVAGSSNNATNKRGILRLTMRKPKDNGHYGNLRMTTDTDLKYGRTTLMIPVLIGLFAVTEVFKQTNAKKRLSADDGVGGTKGKVNTKMPSLKEMWSIKWVLLRCSVVGTVVGILPGAGATIASFMCYTMENKLSKYPEKFGTGIIDGIAASEAANNSATGGAMVPLLCLGIPGGNAAAVMASALALKGVQMGPLLLTNQPEYLSATFITMIITNILMVIVAIGIAKVFAQILAIPYYYLGPIILLLATIGSYSEGGFVGVKVMVIAGVFGIIVKYMHLNSAAIVLGLVLGGMCEQHFSLAFQGAHVITQPMTFSDIMAKIFGGLFGTPIAAVVMSVCILMLLSPIYMPLLKKAKK